MSYNPYTNIAQMQAENQQLMGQLYGYQTQGYTSQQQMIPSQPIRRRGEYVEVANEQEMQSASVRMDGTPTLFVDFAQKIMWAKKYVNGKIEIDIYSFNRPEFSVAQNQNADFEIVNDIQSNDMEKRLSEVEKQVKKILEGKEVKKEVRRNENSADKNS